MSVHYRRTVAIAATPEEMNREGVYSRMAAGRADSCPKPPSRSSASSRTMEQWPRDLLNNSFSTRRNNHHHFFPECASAMCGYDFWEGQGEYAPSSFEDA